MATGGSEALEDRLQATLKLQFLGARAASKLEQVLREDPFHEVRQIAAATLGDLIKDPLSAQICCRALCSALESEPNASIRRMIAGTLSSATEENATASAAALLLAHHEDADADVRRVAGQSLKQLDELGGPPREPVRNPASPTPKPVAPIPRPVAPISTPAAPTPKAVAPTPKPVAPISKPVAPVSKQVISMSKGTASGQNSSRADDLFSFGTAVPAASLTTASADDKHNSAFSQDSHFSFGQPAADAGERFFPSPSFGVEDEIVD